MDTATSSPGPAGLPPNWVGFLEACHRIGRNPGLVQAGGGNASIKMDNRMWVKASGFWLRDCLDKEMFVPLDLTQARQAARSGRDDFGHAPLHAGSLKPSIETGFHALMPHRVVLHCHPINAITATLTASGRSKLEAVLAGKNWTLIEYVKPGALLAGALAARLAERPIDLVVLANHGVIAAADEPDKTAAMLLELEERLQMPRAKVEKQFSPLATDIPGYVPIRTGPPLELANLPERALAISRGAILPDQVVYLGGAPLVARDAAGAKEGIAERRERRGATPGLLILPGAAFAKADLSPGGWALIDLVCEIGLRLPNVGDIALLSMEQETELLDWDAEKYRQQIDLDRHPA